MLDSSKLKGISEDIIKHVCNNLSGLKTNCEKKKKCW